MREHEETAQRASRSSSRGDRAIKSASQTERSAKNVVKQYTEAEDRITAAGAAGLTELGRVEAEEARVRAEEEAKVAAIEERKRSISAKRNRTGW